MELEQNQFWQTQARGTNDQEYAIYLSAADKKTGLWLDGKPVKTYDEWLTKFIKPIIDYVCSHVTKYSCWSVKNIKTDKKYNLLDDVIRFHLDNGWSLERQFSIKKNTLKNKSTDGDVTYVFVKG